MLETEKIIRLGYQPIESVLKIGQTVIICLPKKLDYLAYCQSRQGRGTWLFKL